jgi:NAD(P)-dependent dehydrogenase (short-subunit alcohol dehydrogenase family)
MQKVIFITGASSGFGKVMAGFLAQKGFSVWGTSRKVHHETNAGGYRMIPMDVQDSDSIKAAVTRIIAQNRLRVELDDNSPYGDTRAMVEETADMQMEKAANPAFMGPAVYSIISKEKPELRYRVGSFTEKLSVLLKTILPGRYFEKMILGYYNLK